MRDSWLGLCPRQPSRDKNRELRIKLFDRNTVLNQSAYVRFPGGGYFLISVLVTCI